MTPNAIEQAIQVAIGHHQAGRLADAEGLYRQVLDHHPDHAGALHLLGVLACQVGRDDMAIELIGRAIAGDPAVAEYHGNLGEAYRRSGNWERAIASLRRAIELKPDLADAYNNLGSALRQVGRLDEATAALSRAIELEPGHAQAHYNLGNALKDGGHLDEAIVALGRAIDLKPDHAEAHNNLGRALWDLRRIDQAIAVLDRAIQLKPDLAEAHYNLGNALKDQGRYDEAIAAYDQAIELKPDLVEALNNLGSSLWEQGRLDDALAALDRAVKRKPNYADAHNNLGVVLKDRGCLDAALAHFQCALECDPSLSLAASNRLLSLHIHPDYDAQDLLAEHRAWARSFAAPLATHIRPHANDRAPDRRLRVGLVSPDFRAHPVGRLLLPWLSHVDRGQMEIVCYSDVKGPDSVTAKLQPLAQEWHTTVGLSDPDLADRIRADRIDILVDLALHTAGNRLLVFARKPAPVQVTMLGMPATTGLEAIDYRVTDPYLDPPGETDLDYTERSIRLSHCFWCYEPPEGAPPVSELPATRNGFVTFGCLNHFAKVSRPTLRMWIAILQSLPAARLIIQSQPGSHLEPVYQQFAEAGIARDRVAFVPKAHHLAYLHRYGALDLCLDPAPYNGHTSSLDSLWMGVPVITLAGRTAAGRGGVSILSNAGLTELIALTPRMYVEFAVILAEDREKLAELRAGLRDRMRSSPLMNGQQFATDVETAFRGIWKDWCGQGPRIKLEQI